MSNSLNDALECVRLAEISLKEAREALAKVQITEVELEPWNAEGISYVRRYGAPGDYQIMRVEGEGPSAPGYSQTVAQAVRRAHLDKVNDLLWGLKMQLEPDWGPQRDQDHTYSIAYDLYFKKWKLFTGYPDDRQAGIIYFSYEAALKVTKYLNKQCPEGEI